MGKREQVIEALVEKLMAQRGLDYIPGVPMYATEVTEEEKRAEELYAAIEPLLTKTVYVSTDAEGQVIRVFAREADAGAYRDDYYEEWEITEVPVERGVYYVLVWFCDQPEVFVNRPNPDVYTHDLDRDARPDEVVFTSGLDSVHPNLKVEGWDCKAVHARYEEERAAYEARKAG